MANKRRIPIYAVEFKAPYKLTVPKLVVGLHEIDVARDVINQEGDTFKFYTTSLVATIGTQIFLYMHDLGIPYRCIRTVEAFIFLYILADPIILKYLLYILN